MVRYVAIMSKDNLNGQDTGGNRDGDWTRIDGETTLDRGQLPLSVRFGLGESAVVQVVERGRREGRQEEVAITADDDNNNKVFKTLRRDEEVALGRSHHPRGFGGALNGPGVCHVYTHG